MARYREGNGSKTSPNNPRTKLRALCLTICSATDGVLAIVREEVVLTILSDVTPGPNNGRSAAIAALNIKTPTSAKLRLASNMLAFKRRVMQDAAVA